MKPVKNENLKKYIDDRGLKIRWVAIQAGLDPAYLSGFLSGIRVPTVEEQKVVCKVLKCKIGEIF